VTPKVDLYTYKVFSMKTASKSEEKSTSATTDVQMREMKSLSSLGLQDLMVFLVIFVR
jgi:hypothetical protein